MLRGLYIALAVLTVPTLGFALWRGFESGAFVVLQGRGLIAQSEGTLLLNATLLMLIVLIPVLLLLFFFAWHYRAGNAKARYTPDWEHSKIDELIWWAIPFEVVLVLGALTWASTHELDPHRALASQQPPLHIQVIALEWKWLFIYPQLGIATLNMVEFPTNRPVVFDITADAPMNSFWIPQLGGQIYAMTGMSTSLNLMADTPGQYRGGSANYSGEGFAQMHFNALARPQEEFDAWVASVQSSPQALSLNSYYELAEPSVATSSQTYRLQDSGLYSTILMQYMDTQNAAHIH